MLKKIIYIALIVIACLWLFSTCEHMCNGGTRVITRVDTTYVTVDSVITKYVPKIIKEYVVKHDTTIVKGDTIIVEIPMPVTAEDSAKIINSYFSKRIYVDSLSTKYGYVVVEDEIWQNKIHSRNYSYNFKIPQINTENTVIQIPKRFQLFTGLGFNLAMGQLDYDVYSNELLSPSAYLGSQYRIKDNHFIGAEIDAFRKDLRLKYSFISSRWDVGAEYSAKYAVFNFNSRFFIFK